MDCLPSLEMALVKNNLFGGGRGARRRIPWTAPEMEFVARPNRRNECSEDLARSEVGIRLDQDHRIVVLN